MKRRDSGIVQIVPCIRLGEILMDANQKFLLFCSNCHKDYTTLNAFQKHIHECNGAEQLLAKNAVINFVNNENLYEIKMSETKRNQLKQFRMYRINTVNVSQKSEPNEVNNDISTLEDLESELLDPRWYTVSDKSGPVESTSTTVTPNSGAKIKQQPFKENLKTYKIVNTTMKPDYPNAEVTPRINRLKRSHNFKGQQQQQQKETQPSLLINKQLATTSYIKSPLKGPSSPDAKASPGLQIRRNQPRLIRSLNNKEPKDNTTSTNNNNNNNPKEQNQQNETKQLQVATTSNTKRLLNGSTSCNTKPKPDPQVIVINQRLTRSMNNNDSNSFTTNNSITKNSNPTKGQNQPNEAQQKASLIKRQTSIPITANAKKLSNEFSSISGSVITTSSSSKKPKLSEPTDQTKTPLIKGVTLGKPSRPTIISVTKVNPTFNAVNQNPNPTNVAAWPQLTGSHETKEIVHVHNQIPTKTKETEQILHRLQNLGVEIKRTSIAPTQSTGISTNASKALKIIQKLQSNGVKVVTMKSLPDERGGGGKACR